MINDEMIQQIVEENYDLGKVTRICRINKGFVNESYAIWTEKDGVTTHRFFRFYAEEKAESEVKYELGLMFHIRKKGFTENACPMLTRDGQTYVKHEIKGNERFFAIQEWLTGEEPYSWEYCPLSDGELASVARVMAKLHQMAWDFVPEADYVAKRPPIKKHILGYPEHLKYWLAELEKGGGKEHFVQYVDRRMPILLGWIERVHSILEKAVDLPRTHIHTDAHPGNFKFCKGEVVGLFDFDWAQYDFRLYEVAFILTNFAADWMWDTNGDLSLDKMKLMIEVYNEEMRRNSCGLGELNSAEWEALPDMMIICNVLMLQESVHQIYDDRDRNELEYLYYVVHCMQSGIWIDRHREEIKALSTK